MKLTGSAGASFCRRPDPAMRGALLYGPDAGLVALNRQALVKALTEGDDLRLTRLTGEQVRKDPAELDTALKSRGFFAGRQAVLIDGAKDSAAKAIGEVLASVTVDDGFLVVTAEGLPARSALRKLFEGAGDLSALAFYPQAPSPAEIAAQLAERGCTAKLTPEAEAELAGIGATMDPGSFARLLETVAVFGLDRAAPLQADEIRRLAPASQDAALDSLIEAVALGRPDRVAPLLGRLGTGGTAPEQMLRVVARHFRMLLGVAVDPGGPEAGLGRVRPPLFGPRRRAAGAQISRWGAPRLEAANRLLFQTERLLRTPGQRPAHALIERCLLRLAMMAGR